jgi:N-formylglutamate amidohydrolase
MVAEILQSNIGNEFLGKCIEIIKSFYGYIHIVKGRAYHPQTQGKVERGHAPFKEALQKWMAQHGTNWMIGAHVVNHEINQQAQWNRDNLSPFNIMYGKKEHNGTMWCLVRQL